MIRSAAQVIVYALMTHKSYHPGYQMTERVAQVEILPGYSTIAWTCNGVFPGPLSSAQNGVARRACTLPINSPRTPSSIYMAD